MGYADDLLIFINGAAPNLKRFKNFLEAYQKASGQNINYKKSQFQINTKVTTKRLHNIQTILEMTQTKQTMKYLGCILHKGINKALSTNTTTF